MWAARAPSKRCGKRAQATVALCRTHLARFPCPVAIHRPVGAEGLVARAAGLQADAHVDGVFGASCVRRIERPLSSMRCASRSRRSQMASA